MPVGTEGTAHPMKPIALVFSAAIALAPATAAVQAQERLNDTQLIETLNVLDQSKSIDVAALRRQAVDSVAAKRNLRTKLVDVRTTGLRQPVIGFGKSKRLGRNGQWDHHGG